MRANEEQLRAWMIAGLNGSSADHAQLLRALVPIIRAYYRRQARNRDSDVEDLVQETLIAVHTKRATYDRKRSFTAWLFAIARYKMIDHFRRLGRLVPLESVSQELATASFADVSNARVDMEELLASLPGKQARTIRATRIEGRSIAETAKAEGIGQSDVKVSVHRGLKTLKRRVQESR